MTETPTAVAPEDEVHTSAMIALMGGPAGAPPDAHITVMYLGDVVDMDEATHAAIVEAVGAIAATTAPFDVMLIGCGIFGDPDEPATVMFAQSDPLADLHDAVEEELELRGVEIDSDYPTWIPHITMGYGIPATPEMVALIGTTVHFDRLTLAWAGDMTDVPFTGVLAPEDDGISMDPTEPADVPGVVPGAAPAPTTPPAPPAP
jgi:2'-5' RNA ligase